MMLVIATRRYGSSDEYTSAQMIDGSVNQQVLKNWVQWRSHWNLYERFQYAGRETIVFMQSTNDLTIFTLQKWIKIVYIQNTQAHQKVWWGYGWMMMSHCRWASNAFKINCCMKQKFKAVCTRKVGLTTVPERIRNIHVCFSLLLLLLVNDSFHRHCH